MKKLRSPLIAGTIIISLVLLTAYHLGNSQLHNATPYKEKAYFSEILLSNQIDKTFEQLSYIASAHQIKNIPVFSNQFNDIDFKGLSVLADNIPDPKISKDISNIDQLQKLVKLNNAPTAVVYLYRILSDLHHQGSEYGFTYAFNGEETHKIDALLQLYVN